MVGVTYREDGEDVGGGRDVDPTISVLVLAGCGRLPVGILFALNRGADEQAAYGILGGDDKQTVVSVRADTTTSLALAVSLIGLGEAQNTHVVPAILRVPG